MAWTIYGTPLRPGYCEAHPDVPKPWPCYIDREMIDPENGKRYYGMTPITQEDDHG